MRSLISFVILALAFAGVTFGQDRMTAQQFYERCGDACNPVQPGVSKSRVHAASSSFGPANILITARTADAQEEDTYFYLRTSTGEFARRGEEVKLYLDIVKAHDQPVSIYGRRAKLNEQGNWESFNYFSAEAGDGGWLPNLHLGQSPVLAFSGKVSGEQQVGDGYDFDVLVVDAQTGTLLQQAFTGYSVVVNRNVYGRGYNYLDRAFLVPQNNGAYVVLDGSIPTWSPLAIEFVSPDQFGVSVPIPVLAQAANIPSNIKQLQVNFGVFNAATSAVDVVMAVKVTRRHYTLPKAFVVGGL